MHVLCFEMGCYVLLLATNIATNQRALSWSQWMHKIEKNLCSILIIISTWTLCVNCQILAIKNRNSNRCCRNKLSVCYCCVITNSVIFTRAYRRCRSYLCAEWQGNWFSVWLTYLGYSISVPSFAYWKIIPITVWRHNECCDAVWIMWSDITKTGIFLTDFRNVLKFWKLMRIRPVETELVCKVKQIEGQTDWPTDGQIDLARLVFFFWI